jgi:hypothetical protein
LKRYLFVLFMAVLIIFPSGLASAGIKVIAEPGTDPAIISDIRQTVDAFNSVLKETTNTRFDSNMNIFVCPDRQVFEQVIARELKVNVSPEDTPLESYLVTNKKKQTIIANAATGQLKENYQRAEILSIFLFLQWQYELRGGKPPDENRAESRGELDAFYWIDQGTADYIGARVAERRGLRSMEEWKNERVEFLRRTYPTQQFTPKALFLLSLRSWAMWLVPSPAYKADLLVAYLFRQDTEKRLAVLPEYYSKSADTKDISLVFEQEFGMRYEQFANDYSQWYSDNILTE